MPMYEYECSMCGVRFEKLQRMSERAQALPCTDCGSKAGRIFSSPSLLSGVNDGSSKGPRTLEPVQSVHQTTNCTFENVGTGISLPEGANVKMKGNKFKNVKTSVEFRKK